MRYTHQAGSNQLQLLLSYTPVVFSFCDLPTIWLPSPEFLAGDPIANFLKSQLSQGSCP